MSIKKMKWLILLIAFQNINAQSISKLKFINEYTIPYNFQFKNTTVGGLSGIDYDAKKNVYYMISDDRSAINPARFYTAKIHFTQKGIDSVEFVNVTTLLQKNGKPYPNNLQDKFHVPDPEALRLNVATNQFIWSSEGERKIRATDTILENPAVTIISKNGKYIDTFALPKNLLMQATEKGPRVNGVFEGLTFANNYKTLYVSVEEPLYEDAERADVYDNDAYIRILKFNTATKKCIAQYAYKLDPVAHPAIPENAYKVNGIPDILYIGNNKMLVMERSFSTGNMACTIKVFETDLNNASNIINNKGMKTDKNFTPATKKLLFNFDDLGIYIDNVEGVTFGPTLPNGHKTLLFVVDNNFSPLEKTQFFLFEIIP
ncbi:MAG: esterase-like activity of phytase family protein [Bacteroidetes bacterium]|nr:esterase-like activity of phytase family protein [Bacteroidota bacterium]